MNNSELTDLNKLIHSYVCDDDFLFEDFDIVKKLNNHILINPYLSDCLTKDKILRINNSYKISCAFLETIDIRYLKYLKDKWDSGIFDFNFKKTNICAETYYDEESQKNIISLPVKNTLEDSFTITHEIIHEMNLDNDNFSFSFYVLCEALALLSEFLLEDYLNKTQYKSFLRNKRDIFQTIINFKAKSVDIELHLLDKYLKNGYISNSDIKNYIMDKPKPDRELYQMFINNILYMNELSIDVEQRNIIGVFFASYMHNRILEDSKKMGEFIFINDNINEMDLYDIFKTIGIKVCNEETGDLTDQSYQKLFKSYDKELKSII